MKYQTALIAIVTHYADGEALTKVTNVIGVTIAIKLLAPSREQICSE